MTGEELLQILSQMSSKDLKKMIRIYDTDTGNYLSIVSWCEVVESEPLRPLVIGFEKVTRG